MLVLLKRIFLKRKKKKPSLRERIEKYTEAITFAEAGIDETKDLVKEKAERARVIVVGNEHTFSEVVQNYALGFAERLHYDIIALNVAPIEQVKSLEPYCDSLCEQFKAKCCETVECFEEKCKNKNIKFTHVVRFGKVDDCISEVNNKFDKVEFVITEPKEQIGDRYVVPVFAVTQQ